MVKVIYNDKLLYKVVIWVFLGISLWKQKEALSVVQTGQNNEISNTLAYILL